MRDEQTEQHTVKGFSKPDDIKLAELGAEAPKTVCGLALSGGGIRSASFALGVVQAFLRPRPDKNTSAFDEFQYLSTVSGGGYLGGALTWLRSQGLDLNKQLDGRSRGVHSGEDKNWLDYIRQHGNYLRPNGVTWLSLISVVLRNVLIGFALHFSLVILLFSAAMSLNLLPAHGFPINVLSVPSLFLILIAIYLVFVIAYPVATYIGSFRALDTTHLRASGAQPLLGFLWTIAVGYFLYWQYNDSSQFWPVVTSSTDLTLSFMMFGATLIIFAISVATLILTLVADREGGIPSSNYRARLFLQEHAGALLGLILATGVITMIPLVYHFLSDRVSTGWLSAVSGASGVVGGLYQFARGRSPLAAKGFGATVRLLLTASLLIFGVFLGAYAIVVQHGAWISDHRLLGFAAVFFLGLFVNANYFGISRMYRDRLMETFMPDKKTIEACQWSPAIDADTKPISTMCGDYPYHLINTNVVLVDASRDHYRGRGGDNFLISPKFCGSEATGYISTKSWLKNRMNLPTAVAISGAAVNPNAACGGQGVTRNRLVSFLLGVLQIRLGYWAPNTRQNLHQNDDRVSANILGKNALWKFLKRTVTTMLRPNFWMPGLRQGLLGRGLHSRAVWLELTDGGHFDNTAVYELVKRQADLIVLSMASADAGFEFADLANVIRKVRVDFGAHVNFEADALDLMTPKPDLDGFAAKGYAVADIRYGKNARSSKEKHGKLVIIAATPVADMEPELLAYLKANKLFPHEPTSDQFYDERQLEAYRELGYLIAKQFLKAHPRFPLV